MCLTIRDKNFNSKKIAENDFLTYKVVKVCDEIDEKIVRSYYYDYFVYGKIDADGIFHPKEIQNIDIEAREHMGKVDVENAYHSYSGNIIFNSFYCDDGIFTIRVKYDTSLGDFYYSFHDVSFSYDIAVMECIIPKGTEYFENEFGVIASENIKPIKIHRVENMCGKFFNINS